MKNIIFIAPPAAGKGTMSKMIHEEYNIPHISTGDLLRDEVAKESELGKYLKEEMDKGHLIDDELIIDLLKARLCLEDCNNGYILDGYPRNTNQAIAYDQMLKELNKEIGLVIFLDIDKDLAKERTLSRIICPVCGTSYNLKNEKLMPKKEGICDKCHSTLKVRSDDNEKTFSERFDTYLLKTRDLIKYYQAKKVLKTIKISKLDQANDIFNKVKEIVNN